MNNLPIARTLLIGLLLSLALPATAATRAGNVVYAFGDVLAVSGDGRSRALTRGDSFGPGDTVTTRNGRAQLRFTDGGFAALQPNTEYRVEDYHFEGDADGSERSFMNLVRGSVRLVTGLIGRANKKNFRLRTAVATIGIRGTAGKVSHCDANCGERGPGTSLAGYGGVWDLSSGSYNGPVEPGQAKFCDGGGCFDIPGFGQRRDVAAGSEEETDELDESLDENDENVAGRNGEADFQEGVQSDDSGLSCELGGQCGTDLQVALGQIGAGAFREGNFGDTEVFDNAAIVFNNGVPVAGVTIGDGSDGLPVSFLVTDPAALRQALLDFPDAVISAAGLRILDAIPLPTLQALRNNPASVGVGDFGLTDDGRLIKGRWHNGLLLDVEATLNASIVKTELIRLTGFQSEHFIFGPDPGPVPTSGVGAFRFTGGTFSTAVDGSSIGRGVTEGALLFDFLAGTGAVFMTVDHAPRIYQVFGALQLENDRMFFETEAVAITSGGANVYEVGIDGFFATRGANGPQAAGLAYVIETPINIMGVAGFGRVSSVPPIALPLFSQPAALGTYVAFASSYQDGSGFIGSNAFDFVVNGTTFNGSNDVATRSGGFVDSFTSTYHPGLCSPPCEFDANGVGPAPDSGNYAPLGATWARFGPGHDVAYSGLAIPRGSAHVIALEVPTTVAATPALTSGLEGTYSIIKGGTRPTVIFETGGSIDPVERVGNLTTANMTITFDTGAISTNFAGNFPDGVGTGTWSLSGAAPSCPSPGCFVRADAIHAVNLSGTVTSSQISDPGASPTNCGSGCGISGHTHFDLGGVAATAVAGSIQAQTFEPGTPGFAMSGTYLIEGSVGAAVVPP